MTSAARFSIGILRRAFSTTVFNFNVIRKERALDWFETLTGFSEKGYEETRDLFTLEDGQLTSTDVPLDL
jgi:hypothetical protein